MGAQGGQGALEAIVVLGCRLRPLSEAMVPSAALERRLDAARSAFLERGARVLLVSGGRVWGPPRREVDGAKAVESVEARVMAATLARQGIPAEALRLETWSRSTVENAVCSAVFLRREQILKVGLVSCAWHLPRALRSFRALGFQVEGIPAAAAPCSSASALLRYVGEHLRGVKDALLLPRLEPLAREVRGALDAPQAACASVPAHAGSRPRSREPDGGAPPAPADAP